MSSSVVAADWSLDDNPQLARYFESQVARIEQSNPLSDYQTLEQWEAAKPRLRQQLFNTLGLDPLPQRTPLRAQVTGITEEAEFRVEKIHFQSSPGLYVTANLYLPKTIEQPLPTVLYVCGHARVKDGDISFGNKVGYQHHGAWFARNGYACLTIDTIQLGEIEGVHHGTYKHNRWWWNARGYTPAGVEAWNCMRALDYLETRPEVDSQRFGVTGRSGGGAYSWWISALDERIKCAVPVAGITTLRNHVVDGCVEGHCDCMYMVNTFRRDYATVAALVAPRPLLISNTDKDRIFPLDGVVEIHQQTRHIYDLYGKPDRLGLQITEGPHQDTQELRIHAFRWMNRWLKQNDGLVETTATKFFDPPQLRVFSELPSDERNTTIDEDFVSAAAAPSQEHVARILNNQAAWFDETMAWLNESSFAAWPPAVPVTTLRETVVQHSAGSPQTYTTYRLHFESEEHVPLVLDVIIPGAGHDAERSASLLAKATTLRLFVADADQWKHHVAGIAQSENTAPAAASEFVRSLQETVDGGNIAAIFCPRGVGPTAWVGDEKKQIQIRRRFQLIGTTIDTARVWDIRRAIALLKSRISTDAELHVESAAEWSWLSVMAAATKPIVTSLRTSSLSLKREHLPVFLNAARRVSPQELLALGLFRVPLELSMADSQLTKFAESLATNKRWTGKALLTP